MLAQAVQRVAEKEKLAELGVIKWFHAEVIARAKQNFLARVPDGECEIPAQMLHTIRAPGRIRAQDQARISGSAPRGALALLRKVLFQFLAAVNARIRGDPQLSVEACGLLLNLRFGRGAQHRVAQANRTLRPGLAPVRPAKRKKMRKP